MVSIVNLAGDHLVFFMLNAATVIGLMCTFGPHFARGSAKHWCSNIVLWPWQDPGAIFLFCNLLPLKNSISSTPHVSFFHTMATYSIVRNMCAQEAIIDVSNIPLYLWFIRSCSLNNVMCIDQHVCDFFYETPYYYIWMIILNIPAHILVDGQMSNHLYDRIYMLLGTL